jgi:hypothetical protein
VLVAVIVAGGILWFSGQVEVLIMVHPASIAG